MKNPKQIIEKIKSFLKLKKVGKTSLNKKNKKNLNVETEFSPTYLNEYNRKILKRYDRPLIKEITERKRIFMEVREVLNDIELKLRDEGL